MRHILLFRRKIPKSEFNSGTIEIEGPPKTLQSAEYSVSIVQSFRNFRAPFPEVSAVDLAGRLFWHTLGCQGCKHHNGKPLTTQCMPEVAVIKPNHLHYVSETPALKKRKGVLYFYEKGALLNRNIHNLPKTTYYTLSIV